MQPTFNGTQQRPPRFPRLRVIKLKGSLSNDRRYLQQSYIDDLRPQASVATVIFWLGNAEETAGETALKGALRVTFTIMFVPLKGGESLLRDSSQEMYKG